MNDFTLARYEDGVLTISLQPPTAIGGWDVRFRVTHRFGGGQVSGEAYVNKSVASGFNGASGITITSSGQGVMNVRLNSIDSSGIPHPGAHAYTLERHNSGFRTVLKDGWFLVPY